MSEIAETIIAKLHDAIPALLALALVITAAELTYSSGWYHGYDSGIKSGIVSRKPQ
jgi:hypothetical protein